MNFSGDQNIPLLVISKVWSKSTKNDSVLRHLIYNYE